MICILKIAKVNAFLKYSFSNVSKKKKKNTIM